MSGQETRVNEFGVEVSRHRIFGWQDQDTFVRNGDLFQLVNGKDMQLGRAVFPPGSEYEMHRHPHEQFSVLLAGRLLLTVGNETREIGPGDCWYVPGDVEHGGQVLGDEPVVFLDVYSPATRWIIDMLNGPGIRRVPAGMRAKRSVFFLTDVQERLDCLVCPPRQGRRRHIDTHSWEDPF